MWVIVLCFFVDIYASQNTWFFFRWEIAMADRFETIRRRSQMKLVHVSYCCYFEIKSYPFRLICGYKLCMCRLVGPLIRRLRWRICGLKHKTVIIIAISLSATFHYYNLIVSVNLFHQKWKHGKKPNRRTDIFKIAIRMKQNTLHS